jgi:hypothetical protein
MIVAGTEHGAGPGGELAGGITPARRRSPSAGPILRHPRRLVFFLLAIAPLTLVLFACPLFDPAASLLAKAAPENISTTADQVTLDWDPPDNADTIVSYTVSYRLHGTSTWTTLGTSEATSSPFYTVLHSAVGVGEFDFAVSATDSSGNTSSLHSSLDATADPTSGWYLNWGG